MPREIERDGETYVELYHGYSQQHDDPGLIDWLEQVGEDGLQARDRLDHKDTSLESPFDDYICFYDTGTAPRELLQFVQGPSLRVEVPADDIKVHPLVEGRRADTDSIEPYHRYDCSEAVEYLVEDDLSPEHIDELYLNGHPERLQFALDARWEAQQEWENR